LSRAADAGMRIIVATIQRDQNAIIRDEEAHTLVIQGVAGSGKTSIAVVRNYSVRMQRASVCCTSSWSSSMEVVASSTATSQPIQPPRGRCSSCAR
jgi:hypothetical protein